MLNKMEKLLKINLWIAKFLLFSIPFVCLTIITAYNVPNGGSDLHGALKVVWEIFTWHTVSCFIIFIYLILCLVFWSAFRERILEKLTFSKERDERESFISGKASKATFYSTLATLILFFFFSGLHLHMYKTPNSDPTKKKDGKLYIGFNFKFINSAADENAKNTALSTEDESKREYIIKVDGVPFTQESIFLFLILYHVASYHVFSKFRVRE